MLEVADLDVAYGDAPALWNVSLTVRDRELVAIVGPNGAGKTTLINAIAGLLPARRGDIRFGGHNLSRCAAHQVCGHGIAIVPEGRRLFIAMTVEENLEIGCYVPTARTARQKSLDRVYSIFPILRERRRQAAGALSGGMQQMLAIGRALMACPRLLLLDEPSLGLAPGLVDHLFEVVTEIHRDGVAVLLVEQNVAKALEIAGRAYVLEQGRIVSEGPPADLLRQPHIQEAYLGHRGQVV
ncbi:MAG: ABC transporter ATP-binding protein [Candidatus Rokubacteria bacterium]|nr:ABC transporter ATP-binding protein [Candidatus Rokubacteria bacterium]